MKSIVWTGVATVMASALTLTAQAADRRVPVYKAPVAATVFNWTGCYGGGQLGGQWAHVTAGIIYPGDAIHSGVAASRDFNSDGRFLYGGQIGCNWQAPGSAFVIGVEGDLIGLERRDADGQIFRFIAPSTDHFNTTDRYSSQGSTRLRAGYAVDRTLIYVAGGWTRARLDATHTFSRDGDGSLTFDSSTTRDGWNIGIGAEYAWLNNWTVGLEYRYTDYGSFSRSVPGGTAGTLTFQPFTVTVDNLRTSDVRLRLNYLFGGPAMRLLTSR